MMCRPRSSHFEIPRFFRVAASLRTERTIFLQANKSSRLCQVTGVYTFTDQAKFQFSFFDAGGPICYVDDILIAATPSALTRGLIFIIH